MAAVVDAHLRDLSVVLGTAALTSLACQRLHQSPVLGYLLAGMLLGPHVPGIAVDGESRALTHHLSELGVILLMFTIGLEFNLRRIARIGVVAGLTAVIEVGLMVSLGFLVGRLFGWTRLGSFFVGACVAISSTMIVGKSFEDQRLRGGVADLVFAVLVCEDLLAILMLALLTAVASGSGLSPVDFAAALARLFGFLLALLVAGLLVVPRLIRRVVRGSRPETTLIASVAVCFAMAMLASAAGYSVALGAFLAGLLVAESGDGAQVERLVLPLRDIFAAIFFISIGMMISPAAILAHWPTILALTATVLLGKLLGVSLGAFLTGNGLHASIRAGMSLAQIGEFSFIIAGLARGAVDASLLRIVVAVSLLTSVLTPVMIRRSSAVADAVEHRLPPRLRTLVAFHELWIAQLRATPREPSTTRDVRRDIVLLTLDACLLLAAVAGSSFVRDAVVAAVAARLRLPARPVDLAWTGLALVVAAVFLLGALRHAAALARRLARVVLPDRAPAPTDGVAPRAALTIALELALCLAVGLPLVALSAPFMPLSTGLLALILLALALAYNIWHALGHLHGHVRAGTELVVDMVARQHHEASEPLRDATGLAAVLPALAGMSSVRLDDTSAGVGHTLGQLNLRVRTGAAILAIHREAGDRVQPTPRDRLELHDIVVLAGAPAAVAAATDILHGGPALDPTYHRYSS